MGNSLEQWRSSIGSWGFTKFCCHKSCQNVYNFGFDMSSVSGDVNLPNLLFFMLAVLSIILLIGGIELNPGPVVEDKIIVGKTEDKIDWSCDQLKALHEELNCAKLKAEEERQRAERERRLREKAERKLIRQFSDVQDNSEVDKNSDRPIQNQIAALQWEKTSTEFTAKRESHRADLEKSLREEAEKQREQLLGFEQACKVDQQNGQKILQLTSQEESSESDQDTKNGSSIHKYEKTKSRADMRGELYEVKMNLLIFCRAVNQGLKFFLGSNMKGAGLFDDCVLKIGQQIMCIQMKHRKECKNLYMSQLVQLKGDFSLLKYYKSYCEIKKNWSCNTDLQYCGKFENAIFIFYTNAKFRQGTESKFGNMKWQNILSSGGKYFSFDKETYPEIYELFQQIPEYKKMINDAINDEQFSNDSELLKIITKLLNNNAKILPSKEELQKLLDELDSLGDLSDYENFLSHLWFFTNQVDEDKLDNIILDELKTLCGTYEICNIYTNIFAQILHWWKDERCFLTDESQILQDIMLPHIDSISEHLVQKLKMFNLRFHEDELSSLRTFLPAAGEMVHFVTEGTAGSNNLTCLKVHQSLGNDKHLLVSTSTLQTQEDRVFALWGRWCNLLVVMEDDAVSIDSLMEVLCSQSNKRLAEDTAKPGKQSAKRLAIIAGNKGNGQLKEQRDSVNFQHFDRECQDRLLDVQVSFQGHDITFREFIGDDQELLPLLSAENIIQLNNNKLVIGEPLSSDIDCYIPRTLQVEERVQSEILYRSIAPVKIVVSGMTSEDVQNLLETKMKYNKAENLDKYELEIINNEDGFLKLSESYKNIHWIHQEQDRLIWKKSRGDMSLIRAHLCEETYEFKNVDSPTNVQRQVIVISDSPGMGKTTLLTHLALGEKVIHPATWVIRVNLNIFSHKLDGLPKDLDMSHVKEFILDVCGITDDLRVLFRQKLGTLESVCLLFDGYDEISPNHELKVLQMLKLLQTTKLQTMWVTTRPNKKDKLEKELCTMAFSIQPFSSENQRHFLNKFWKKSMPGTDESILNKFADNLLQVTEKSLNDRDKHFMGIPLQTMLLAEAFQESLGTYTETPTFRLPQKLNLLQLFNQFVEKKFDIYLEKMQVDRTKAGLSQNCDELKVLFRQNHMIAGLLNLLSPNEVEFSSVSSPVLVADLIKQNKTFITKIEECHEKVGIVREVINGQPIFVHKTFAEYFAAHWFEKNYQNITDGMKEKLLESRFQIVRVFFDSILCQEFDLHTAVINQDKDKVEDLLTSYESDHLCLRDKGGRTALFLAVMNYVGTKENDHASNEILKALLRQGGIIECEDTVFHYRPLQVAVKSEAWYAVGLLLQKGADPDSLSLMTKYKNKRDYVENVLNVAISKGFLELTDFMILQCGIPPSFRWSMECRTHLEQASMLHHAAKHNQLDLVKLLLDKHSANIEALDRLYHRTPLIWAAEEGNLDIVKYLIEHGANITIQDSSGSTVLLRAAENGQFEVVKMLLEKSLDLKMKASDSYGNHILHCAVISGNTQLVEFLLDKGLSIEIYNKKHQTPLWLAARYGHLGVTQLLLEHRSFIKAFIHISDNEYRHTPLHAAAMWGHIEVVKCLAEHGANRNVRDINRQTPLHTAKKYKRSEVVEYLKSFPTQCDR